MGLILVQRIKDVKALMVSILNVWSLILNAEVMHVVKTVQIHYVVKMMESAAIKILFTMEQIPMNVGANVMMLSLVTCSILYK